MKSNFTKGKANRETLSDRMKRYEAVTTDIKLIERIPVYARIDQRAGHTWCHNLDKPFDINYSDAMKAATSYIVDKTGAKLGYCQSDEASFVWEDTSKMPFESRLFKLQSVFASMFTAAFMNACRGPKMCHKLSSGALPSFDCRICNMPNMSEAANMILWRQQDSVKNSITLLALEHFSTKQIDKKSGKDKIQMLKDIGVDYYTALSESQRLGSFFRKENYQKILTEDELKRIPERNWPEADDNGNRSVIRSHVVEFFLDKSLSETEDKVKALFN